MIGVSGDDREAADHLTPFPSPAFRFLPVPSVSRPAGQPRTAAYPPQPEAGRYPCTARSTTCGQPLHSPTPSTRPHPLGCAGTANFCCRHAQRAQAGSGHRARAPICTRHVSPAIFFIPLFHHAATGMRITSNSSIGGSSIRKSPFGSCTFAVAPEWSNSGLPDVAGPFSVSRPPRIVTCGPNDLRRAPD